jgi:hypothetical protein
VQLSALQCLLLRVGVEDERVEAGQEVEPVGDPLRRLDHTPDSSMREVMSAADG